MWIVGFCFTKTCSPISTSNGVDARKKHEQNDASIETIIACSWDKPILKDTDTQGTSCIRHRCYIGPDARFRIESLNGVEKTPSIMTTDGIQRTANTSHAETMAIG